MKKRRLTEQARSSALRGVRAFKPVPWTINDFVSALSGARDGAKLNARDVSDGNRARGVASARTAANPHCLNRLAVYFTPASTNSNSIVAE